MSPQVIRHTTAMPRLQAGVDMAVTALWVGHERLETPPVDLEADRATQARALDPFAPIAKQGARFIAADPPLAFLTSR